MLERDNISIERAVERGVDCFQHALDIFHHVVVPEPQDTVALLLQRIACAGHLFAPPPRVHAARSIDLNN
jgi:hypothetical protein